jgi:hypothetical protein
MSSRLDAIQLSVFQIKEEQEKWMDKFHHVESVSQAATMTLETHALKLETIDLALQTDRKRDVQKVDQLMQIKSSCMRAINSCEETQRGLQLNIHQLTGNLASEQRILSQLQASVHDLTAKHEKLQGRHEKLQSRFVEEKSRSPPPPPPPSAVSSEPELLSDDRSRNSNVQQALFRAPPLSLRQPLPEADESLALASRARSTPTTGTSSSPVKHVHFSEGADQGLPVDELGLLNWDGVPAAVRKALRGLAVQLEIKGLSVETLVAALDKDGRNGVVDERNLRIAIKGLGVHMSDQNAQELFLFWDYSGSGSASISDVRFSLISVQLGGNVSRQAVEEGLPPH